MIRDVVLGIAGRFILLFAIALCAAPAAAQKLERLPPVAEPAVVPASFAAPAAPAASAPASAAMPATVPSVSQQPLVAVPEILPAAGTQILQEPSTPLQRLAALQPLTPGGADVDRLQGEQRIRDLEGLGPAPGTTSEDENKSTGAVPDKPTVAWTGELQADVVMLSQSPANIDELGQLENFSDFRRGRLGAIGSLWSNTIYRIEFDFAQQGRPTFLDLYGQFTDLPVLGNLRIGHFFEPFAISRLTSNRYQSFMERPLLDAFAPVRNMGIMAFDTYADKRGTWQLGLFAADSNDDGEEQTDRGGTAVTGRATFLPYWDEPSDGRYYMHVGGCFSYRLPPDQTSRFGYWPGFRPGSFDTIIWPRWANTGLIPTNDVTLFDLEWAWVMGPWHVQAEVATNHVDQIGGPNLNFYAWYVETGWFLTGEHRPYQQEMATFNRVTPFESFYSVRTQDGIRRGRGAWQAVFRIDDLNLNNGNVQGGRLVDLSFGLNWHLNPYSKIYFNYVHAMLNRDEPNSYGDLFGMRAQFEF